MAIKQGIENEYGVKFDYHKIKEVRIKTDGNETELILTVFSWKDKQARIEGKQPTVRNCIITNADFALNPFYSLLKAKFPDFTKGTDDFNNDFKADKEKTSAVNYLVQDMNGDIFQKWKEN